MKSDKELLKLLLRRIRRDFTYFPFLKKCYLASGMCRSINIMEWKRIINFEEAFKLRSILNLNKPKDIYTAYWWKSGRKRPRIKFVKGLIKKYSKQ